MTTPALTVKPKKNDDRKRVAQPSVTGELPIKRQRRSTDRRAEGMLILTTRQHRTGDSVKSNHKPER